MDLLPIIVFALAIANALFTVFQVWLSQKETRITLNALGNQLTEGIEDINIQLQPLTDAVSRSMGAISSVSDSVKQEKALERRIGQDLIGQNEDVLEMIKMAFPRVSEYIEEHPEAISKLMPRLNTLISDPEARKRLNLDISGKSSDVSRIWNE